MNSESERAGGHSPVRRRLIALAGAGGAAGLAGILWPWKEAAVPQQEEAAGKANEVGDASATQTAPDASPEAPAVDSSVSAERERFASHRGEEFKVASENATLVLDEVGELVRMAGQGRRFEGYSLLFKIQSGALPGDGVFRLSHAALGELEFYLGAVAGPVTPSRCEVVISRVV
jgi:hypothetical protein